MVHAKLPEGGQLGPHEVGNAAAAALRELSRDRPLLLAIDDLPWIDRATITALEDALSRLGGEGLRVLATRRTPSTLAAAPPAPKLLPVDDLREVPVAAIDAPAAADLLVDRLDLRLPATVLNGLVEHSGGNPFWILEFGAALRRGEGDRVELPVPTALADLVGERLGSLTPDARQALVVTAALAQPSPALVIRALDGQTETGDAGRRGWDRAVADGVLTVSRVAGGLEPGPPAARRRRPGRAAPAGPEPDTAPPPGRTRRGPGAAGPARDAGRRRAAGRGDRRPARGRGRGRAGPGRGRHRHRTRRPGHPVHPAGRCQCTDPAAGGHR